MLGIINLASAQNFPQTLHFSPLMRTRTCAYQGVRNKFFRKFCARAKLMIPFQGLKFNNGEKWV